MESKIQETISGIPILYRFEDIPGVISKAEENNTIAEMIIYANGPSNVCYLGTENQDFLYNPMTYTSGSPGSNLSVPMQFQSVQGIPLTVKISNQVIPSMYLGLSGSVVSQTRGQSMYGVQFIPAETPWTYESNPSDKTQFAFYYNDGTSRYYLQPSQLSIYGPSGLRVGLRDVVTALISTTAPNYPFQLGPAAVSEVSKPSKI